MMRLEHINMVVRDMADTLRFYQNAFPHWVVRTQGQSNWYGSIRKWLHFGDDYNYLTFNDGGENAPRELRSNDMGVAHLGFEVKNLQALHSRMEAAGYQPSHRGAEHPHRQNLYYIDPNGFEVEFVEYLSDLPSERNLLDQDE